MARSLTDRLLATGSKERPLHTYRKPRPLAVCGWDVPSLLDDIGIVPWMKLQSQYHDKKEAQKSKPPDDVVHFKHLANKKCPSVTNQDTFVNESLHEHFFEKPVKVQRQRTVLLPQSNNVNIVIHKSSSTPNFPVSNEFRQCMSSAREYQQAKLTGTGSSQYRKDYRQIKRDKLLQRNKNGARRRMGNVKDDMEAFSSEDDDNENEENVKRSRSVPVGAEYRIAKNAKLRRLLKIAHFYGSKENLVIDEDEDICDEGYGSKTPSAEDKDDEQGSKPFNLMTWSITGQGLGTREHSYLYPRQPIGKFSYTHQSTKSQLYENSEDDKDEKEAAMEMSARVRYYKQKYGETPREKADYEKMLERTYSSLGKPIEGPPTYNLDIKPVTMVLRKITIQDSKENKSSEPKEIEGLPKTYLFRTNTSFPTERLPEKSQYTDRTQLQMGNTSPEFKFSHNKVVTSQSATKKLMRPSSKADLLKRTHLPFFDFERANTSMPLGDLLPAVDRSILSRSISKSHPEIVGSRSVPNTSRDISVMTRAGTEIVDKCKPEEEVSYFSMDFTYPGKTQVLGAPPFRTAVNKKPQEQTQKNKQDKTNTPNQIPTQPLIKTESKPRVTSSSTQQATTNIGPSTVEISVKGIDIELKQDQEFHSKKMKTFGKVRVTTNPDKDTKKRLREAFSRFYNKQNFSPRAVQDDIQLMWNA